MNILNNPLPTSGFPQFTGFEIILKGILKSRHSFLPFKGKEAVLMLKMEVGSGMGWS